MSTKTDKSEQAEKTASPEADDKVAPVDGDAQAAQPVEHPRPGEAAERVNDSRFAAPGDHPDFLDGTGRYDRAARRLADQRATGAPDALDGDGLRYPELDDVARATYPDPKAAHLKGESPTLTIKRELAEHDRGTHEVDGDTAVRGDGQPVTRLPDGEPADNAKAVAHNEAKHAEAFETLGTEDAAMAARDRDRDHAAVLTYHDTVGGRPTDDGKKAEAAQVDRAKAAGERNTAKAEAKTDAAGERKAQEKS